MAFLELAENSRTYGGESFYQALAENPEQLYIEIPDPNDITGQATMMVREDYFDNLPDHQWEQIMDELEPPMMSGLFDRWRENREKRRQRRDERRAARQESRMSRIESRESGLFGGALKGLTQNIGGALGGLFGGGQTMPMDSRALDLQFTTQQPTFFERNKGLIIGAGVVVLVGGAYLIMKNKKK